MLKKRAADLVEYVWRTAAREGRAAPRVADAILADLFPATLRAAQDEGASKMLRRGLIAEIKRIFRRMPDDDISHDLSVIAPAFRAFVSFLKRPSYFVEVKGEEVVVSTLIATPALLDDARHFMRRKGEECIAEAERLDELYAAVIARGPARGGATA